MEMLAINLMIWILSLLSAPLSVCEHSYLASRKTYREDIDPIISTTSDCAPASPAPFPVFRAIYFLFLSTTKLLCEAQQLRSETLVNGQTRSSLPVRFTGITEKWRPWICLEFFGRQATESMQNLSSISWDSISRDTLSPRHQSEPHNSPHAKLSSFLKSI